MVELARVEVDAPELAPGVVGEEADDLVLAAEGIPALAEDPLRRGELRGAWAHGLVTLAARAVEVPPVAAVGDEVELARRRPLGLQDRFVGTAGDPALRREVPVSVWSDGPGRPAGILPVEALVFEVGEVDRPVLHDVVAAAVLVDAAPGVETLRRDVGGRAVGGALADDDAPTLVRPQLGPVEVA